MSWKEPCRCYNGSLFWFKLSALFQCKKNDNIPEVPIFLLWFCLLFSFHSFSLSHFTSPHCIPQNKDFRNHSCVCCVWLGLTLPPPHISLLQMWSQCIYMHLGRWRGGRMGEFRLRGWMEGVRSHNHQSDGYWGSCHRNLVHCPRAPPTFTHIK